jgi:hypothetical protein
VKLTACGKSVEQPLVVRIDPRVTTPVAGLEQQFKLSMVCYDGMAAARGAIASIRVVRKQLEDRKAKAEGLAAAIDAIDTKLSEIEGPMGGGKRGRDVQPRGASLGRVVGELGRLLAILQGADATPTIQAAAAVVEAKKELDALLDRWAEIRQKDLAELNLKLKAAGLPEIDVSGK